MVGSVAGRQRGRPSAERRTYGLTIRIQRFLMHLLIDKVCVCKMHATPFRSELQTNSNRRWLRPDLRIGI